VEYYDPTPWIATSDSLVEATEARIKVDKVAKSNLRSKGQFYSPHYKLELDVVVKGSGEILRLSEWRDKIGRLHFKLIDYQDTLRRGDFKETRHHHNPNGANIPPPHHIHFPTIKYPLNQEHTYAYPVKPSQDKSGEDDISALRLFCDYTKIILAGVNLPLI